MAQKMQRLEVECQELKKRLAKQSEVQEEIEALKQELERSLEIHVQLQEIALAFEEGNRSLHEKYNIQLKERAALDARLLCLEHELESRKQSYENLERRCHRLQEKVDKYEDMEELVCTLEKDKKKHSERVIELEHELSASMDENMNLKKELEEGKSKLIVENADLNEKLETYIEEMEELDSIVENLENENEKLKGELERYRIKDAFESVVESDELDAEKDQLLSTLHKEVEKRENVEKELFKLEEEVENCTIQHENEVAILKGRIEELESELSGLQNVLNSEEKSMNRVDLGQGTFSHNKGLEVDNADLQSKLRSLEQEREVLIEKISCLGSEQVDLQGRYQGIKESFDTRVAHLESCMAELMEHKNLVEKENHRKYSLSKDRTLTEEPLKCTQDQLQLNPEKSVDLQAQLADFVTQRSPDDEGHQYEVEGKQIVNSRFIKKKEDLIRKMEEEKNDRMKHLVRELQTLRNEVILKAESIGKTDEANQIVEVGSDISSTWNQPDLYHITLKYELDKEDLQNKIIDQSITIQNLEDKIASLIVIANSSCHRLSQDKASSLLPNGRFQNLADHESVHDVNSKSESTRSRLHLANDGEECIGDREIRRVAYRIADGEWVRVATQIGVSHNKTLQIVNSTLSDNEKVYQLLVTWVHEKGLSRTSALKTLLEIFESTKRKDVTNILKEMLDDAGNENMPKKKKLLSFRKSKKKIRKSSPTEKWLSL